MKIAPRVQDYLAARQGAYDVVTHVHSESSVESARKAHVPADALAKAVVLKDSDGSYAMAVLPATRHVAMAKVCRALRRHPLALATEAELARVFADCERGALPPFGRAYGLPTIVDESLDQVREVYFEAGDHEHLVHMAQDEFYRLTSDAPRARFSREDHEEEQKQWMQ